MHRFFKFGLAAVLLAVSFEMQFASAAPRDEYEGPKQSTKSRTKSASKPAATRKSASKTATISPLLDYSAGLFHGIGASVQMVDGRKVSSFWSSTRRVPTGTHTYGVGVSFAAGYFEGRFRGVAQLKATLQAGRTYKPAASVQGKTVSVWLVDAKTGKRVSNVVSPGTVPVPPDIPIIVY